MVSISMKRTEQQKKSLQGTGLMAEMADIRDKPAADEEEKEFDLVTHVGPYKHSDKIAEKVRTP